MLIRKYDSMDCRELTELFYNTVHQVNAKDYSKEQLDAWASGEVDLEQWNRSFQEHYSVVAVENDVITGFGDIDKTGYLDRLYVHRDYQGQGIATAICNALEKTAPGNITVHASITARPFFEKRGYQVLKEQQVERRGVLLTNYVMEKYVASTPCVADTSSATADIPSATPSPAANPLSAVNTPPLETNRLLLRKFTEKDLAALFAIYRDEEVNKYLPWFPLKTMEEAAAFWKERYQSAYARDRAYQYAICQKEDNIPIGYINVSMDDSHDLGYGLRKEFWHKGIVTEAGKAVVERLKSDGFPYITATHDINNPRSGGVMRQLGMQYRYSYEEQWQPKDILVTFRMYQLNLYGNPDWVYQKYWEESKVHFVETEIGN